MYLTWHVAAFAGLMLVAGGAVVWLLVVREWLDKWKR